jgi:Tfp pilus assembly protein PilN
LQESLGISFNEGSIRLVHLKKTWGGIKCAASAEFKLPSFGAASQAVEAANLIKQFLLAQKVRTSEVYATVSPEDVLFKKVTLPATVRENLRQALEYEFENYFPFPQEEVLFDSAFLPPNREGGGELEILLSVIQRNRYEHYMEILHGAGLSAACLEPPLSARISLFQWLAARNLAPFPLIVLAADNKGVEIDFQLAERWEWKHLRRSASLYEDVKQWLFQCESLIQEQKNGDTPRVDLSLLCLNEERLPHGLIDELREYFPLIEIAPLFRTLGLESVHPFSLYAFGSALQAFENRRFAFNFIPAAERPKQSRRALHVFIVLAVAFSLLGGARLVTPYIQAKQKYTVLQQAVSELAGQVEDVENRRTRLKELKRQVEPLAQTKKRDVLLVLKELTVLIPEDSWITNLDLEKDTVRIRGNSENATALIALLEKSPLFKEVTFLSPLFKREGKDVFHLQMLFED